MYVISLLRIKRECILRESSAKTRLVSASTRVECDCFICFQLVHDTIILNVDLLSEAGDFRKLFRTFQGDLPCVIIEFCY